MPAARSSPPIRKAGSRPHSSSASAAIDAVVVLPWVPPTAIVRFMRATARRAGRRGGARGAPAARAAASSGLSSGIAVETTTSAPAGRFAASWPIAGSMPAARSARAVGRLGPVRAGDRGAERAGDQREAAHAGPADPDEVEAAPRERRGLPSARDVNSVRAAPIELVRRCARQRPGARPQRAPRSPSRPCAAARRAARPPRGPGAGPSSSASGTTTAAPASSM